MAVWERPNILRDVNEIVLLGISSHEFHYALKPRAGWLDKLVPPSGSSTFLSNLVQDNELRSYGLRLPTFNEMDELNNRGLISKEHEGIYGAVIFDTRYPNREIADRLKTQAEFFRLSTPLIVPFGALGYVANGKITPYLENPWKITDGDEAIERLNSLSYSSDDRSGMRLLHYNNGQWHLPPYSLESTRLNCLPEWICGNALREENVMEYPLSAA